MMYTRLTIQKEIKYLKKEIEANLHKVNTYTEQIEALKKGIEKDQQHLKELETFLDTIKD